MSKPVSARKRSSTGKRLRATEKAANAKAGRIPHDLASHIRGLYGRVARKLRVDPSYVSRVARGERHSKKIENALRRELNRIVDIFRK